MDSIHGKKQAGARKEGATRRISHARKLETRQRHRQAVYLAAVGAFLVTGALFISSGGASTSHWLGPLTAAMVILALSLAWGRVAPVCPNCQKNIETCQAVYCHVCGEPLADGRCPGCGVLQSWTHIFTSTNQTAGNKQPIKYCPGCGALLDTNSYRWLGGGHPG
jgi:hypothetical protein